MSVTETLVEVKDYISDVTEPIWLGFKHLFHNRQTIKYPFEYYEPAERHRGRIINDLEKCINCMLCAKVCPDKCINEKVVAGKKWPEIDFGRCCFCGFCVYVCPPDSLQMTKDHSFSAQEKEDLFYTWNELGEYPETSDWRPGKKLEEKEVREGFKFE